MEYAQKTARKTETAGAEQDFPIESIASDSSSVDDLLDEIDGVLEENAEEFVNSYVQKGGQ